MSGAGHGGAGWNRRKVVQWGALIVALNQRAALPAAAAEEVSRSRDAGGAGYGRDPLLNPPRASRWPRALGEPERAAARWLLDELLPEDEGLPAASEVGLVEFLAEWLGAPYAQHAADRAAILPLLAECARALEDGRESAMRWLQAVSDPPAPAAASGAARHDAFERLRVLAAAAYYTTAPGIAAIGFVGNVPREQFDGPPEEVLQRFDGALRALGG